jgi:hypothetical protein
MTPTFLFSVRLDSIESPLKAAVLREIRNSLLIKLPTYAFSNGFTRYVGCSDNITLSLDYLLDEMLSLDDFVAITIRDNESIDTRGRGYNNHIFSPSLLFTGGAIRFSELPLPAQQEFSEQFTNQL